jgi:hypothetical protein
VEPIAWTILDDAPMRQLSPAVRSVRCGAVRATASTRPAPATSPVQNRLPAVRLLPRVVAWLPSTKPRPTHHAAQPRCRAGRLAG